MKSLDELERRADDQKSRFAGWFFELNSAMTYRLWEQGGSKRGDGGVGLYEAECGLSHDEAAALIAVARAAKAWDDSVKKVEGGDVTAENFHAMTTVYAAFRAAISRLDASGGGGGGR